MSLTIAEVAHDAYVRRCEELDLLSRDYDVIREPDKAQDHRVAAALVWNAARMEERNPDPVSAPCGICDGERVCDWELHRLKRRLGMA